MSEQNKSTNQHTKNTSWLAIFSRRVLKVVLGLMLSLLLLVALLVSPWGSKLAITSANKALDELNIDYLSGGLGSNLQLSSVLWQQPNAQIQLNDLSLSLQLSCVLRFAVCIESLKVGQVNVQVVPQAQQQANASSDKPFTLPIPISIEQISVNKTSIDVQDTATIAWQSLNAKLGFYRRLRLEKLNLHGLNVNLLAGAKNTRPAPVEKFDWLNWQYPGIQATPVKLPIYFDLSAVQLTDLAVTLAEQPTVLIQEIAVAAKANNKKLQIDNLRVLHAQGQLQAKGQVQLNGQFQHQLNIDGQGQIANQPALSFKIRSSGDINQLDSSVDIQAKQSAQGADAVAPLQLSLSLSAQPKLPSLPLELQLAWQSLAWPLEQASLRSKSGELHIKGKMQGFDIAAKSEFSGPAMPNSRIELQAFAAAKASQKVFEIQELLLHSLNGQVKSQGKLTVAEYIDWQGSSHISDIDPSVFWPELAATINGQIFTSANNQQGVWQASLEQLNIQGLWQGFPLQATGKVHYQQNKGLDIPELKVLNANNSLNVTGQLDRQNNLDMQLTIQAEDIADSFPRLSGTLSLDAELTGNVSQPKLNYQFSAQDLLASGIFVQQANGQGKLSWDQEKPISLDIALSGIQGVNNQAESAQLSLQGNAQAHELNLSTTGDTNLAVTIQGQLFESAWQGQWLSGEIQSSYANLQLPEPFKIEADWGNQQYAIAAHCWQDSEHALCIKQAKFANNQAVWDLSIKEFDLLSVARRLLPGLPNIQTASRLNLDMSGDWQLDQLPNAKLNAKLTGAKWLFTNQNNLALDIDQVSVQAEFNQQNIVAELALSGKQIGKLQANIEGKAGVFSQPLSRPVQGQLLIEQIDLAAFKALAPQLDRLEGEINGLANIAGTIGSPLLNGELTLTNGALKDQGLPVALSEIEQRINLQGQTAELIGSYRLGAGTGQLSGQVSWLPNFNGQLQVTGEALEFDYQNMLKAKVSPNIQLAFAPNDLDVSGEVSIPYARIKVRELPTGSISPSKDVVLVEQQAEQQADQQRIGLNLMLNIDPARTNQVKLDAFGLTTDLQGQLRLHNNKSQVFASGEVQLVNGKYRAYGQNLLIQEGDILFTNALDRPFINIEAVRDPALTQDGVVAGLKVEGVAQNPNVSVFSEPVMEQQQALSYILTGRGIGASGGDNQDTMLTNALLSLGLGKSENLITKVGTKLGFEDVNLDTTGQGDETQLSLSGTIAPGVQLRYGVGVFDSVSEVAIRYQLLPKLYLEAVSGVSNAIDIYYQFSIDGKQNQAVNNAQ